MCAQSRGETMSVQQGPSAENFPVKEMVPKRRGTKANEIRKKKKRQKEKI